MRYILFLLILTFTHQGFASNEELTKAFQRETVLLTTQKESLQSESKQAVARHKQAIAKLEAEVKALEVQVVKATSANELIYESLQKLEKEKRELGQRDSSFVSVYKKANKVLSEEEGALRFDLPGKNEAPVPSEVSLKYFAEIKARSLAALKASATVESVAGVYKNKDGQLLDGELLRFGRIGAQVKGQEHNMVVGPDGDGELVALESVSATVNPVPLYLFESLTSKAKVKMRATWIERVADSIPLLMLGFMLLMVLGLFILFARE